ncbi:unnamed protein product [marine sediment metagenome]|uniref:Uncharacterized protein n=1 Tax=marine sediment metagenome TaxID=412755 RepID=X1NIV5_9ZZZZ
MNIDQNKIGAILDRYEGKEEFLILILQDIQSEYKYLPKDVLSHVAEKLGVPLTQIYSIATFYKAFSLEPRGKHLVRVCMGTACHVRGGQRILGTVERVLGVKAGKTTPDRKFTLQRVNCLGCCALGPVMVVDDEYHGGLRSAEVGKILSNYT